MVTIHKLAVLEANPFEAAVIAAWNALFQSGPNNLPAYIKQHFPEVSLPNISDQRLGSAVDLCSVRVPSGGQSPVPKHDAKIDLTSMAFSGLDTIRQSGTVTFAHDDALVHFPAALGAITITGSFNISQECCHPVLWGCTGTYTSHQPGKFTYTVPSSNFAIDAALSPDPQTNKPKFTVVDLDYSFASTPAVHIADDLPSWLDWLKYLDGWFVTQGAIKGALSANVTKSLKSAGFMSQVEHILNSVA